MIKIYFSSYSNKLSSSDFSGYLNLLPPELEQRIMRYKRWEDRHASLYGKLLLMKALEKSGFDPDLLHLKYTNYGRPYLENVPDFNISHSGLFAVCALSLQGKIGIDIEEIKPAVIYDFEEEFSKEEWNIITTSDDKYFWFYYYWTAKEAVIKAEGKGLNIPLKGIAIKNSKTKIEHTVWHIKRIDFDNNYLLQIASDEMIQEKIDISEIAF